MPQSKIPFSILQKEKGVKCCNSQSKEEIQYHHIIPISAGGFDIISNIAPLCPKCHALIHSKKAMASSTLIKQGIAKAKAEGKRIGQPKGAKLNTQKSIESKQYIINNSRDFNGLMTDIEIIKKLQLSRNTFYKYKKELKDDKTKWVKY